MLTKRRPLAQSTAPMMVLRSSVRPAAAQGSPRTCSLCIFFNASVGGLASFDHLVVAGKQSWWNVEAERLRGLEIDD